MPKVLKDEKLIEKFLTRGTMDLFPTKEAVKEKLGVDSFKEINSYEDLIGEKMFFRTVTYFALGEIKKIVGRFVYLKDASWIADTGKFSSFIKDGIQENSEIEYVKEMFLNMDF